ncbi:MAG: hypothetical protein IPJ04_10905 [Candidatus Eisenbacteria bacterium]|nr:hypothetical protein [Candidatus Eisenbacteria bacterium]
MRTVLVADSSIAYGRAVTTRKVYESGAAYVKRSRSPVRAFVTESPSDMDVPSESSIATSKLNDTSVALIGCPSLKHAPRRRWNVSVHASADQSHDFAKSGTSCSDV